MTNHEAISLLNQLLGVVCRSLPLYLANARPWSRLGSWKAQRALDRIVADGNLHTVRVAMELDRLGGVSDCGQFPAAYTAKNDLAVKYLIPEIIGHLKSDSAEIERIAALLENDPALHALAMEILGNVKGHIDVLKKVEKEE